jgi:ABC-type sugar transport system substrate-binding protein
MAFGNNPSLVAALKDGTLQALVADSPFELGYQSVRAMSDVMAGKNVPARVSITTALVTPDKLSAQDVQAFLNPPTLTDIQNAPTTPADAAPTTGNAGDGKASAPAAASGP